MDLNFEEIRRIQRLEKNTPRLVEIDPEFYAHLSGYLKKKKDDYVHSLKSSSAISLEDARDFENMNRLVNDIYERREKKVILRAIRASRTGEVDNSHMTVFEEKMFKDVVSVLEKYKKVINDIFDGNGSSSSLAKKAGKSMKSRGKALSKGNEAGEDKKSGNDKTGVVEDVAEDAKTERQENDLSAGDPDKEGLNIVSVRIIKDMPGFIGPDKVSYGPFEVDQYVELPKHIVDLLVKRNVAEID
ncbi:MAG: DNA replication complex GINS family protein [Candidatus Diapherotrites archaeon]|nr:DNA replication complex GINS family protein [Candidatus Diapherotrites archaeon]